MSNSKKAFTLVELIATMVFMMIIMASVLPILFKKSKATRPKPKDTSVQVFSCNITQNLDAIKDVEIEPDGSLILKWEPENPERDEFYTIELIGGGAGGTQNSKGGAGEAKVVYYPALYGQFGIKLGNGGAVNENGADTVLYVREKEGDDWYPLEVAHGGLATNQTESGVSNIPNHRNDTIENDTCGFGGEIGQAGTMGEVIIRW